MIIVTLISFFLALGLSINLVAHAIIFTVEAIRGDKAEIDSTIHVWLVAILWTVFYWSVM